MPRTFTISLPPELAGQVERAAQAEQRTRSELVREALRQYLARQERWGRIFDFGEQIARRKDLKEQDVARVVQERRRSRTN